MARKGRPSRTALYAQLADQVADLDRLGGLPSPDEAADIWGDVWLQEAHNSTAIEGNTLVLREVELLLSEGRVVGNKELTEYMEVRGYGRAADWVYAQGRGGSPSRSLITLSDVRMLHKLSIEPVWEISPHPVASKDEGPGSFRRHNIKAFPGGMRPPDWTDVHPQITDWVRRANRLTRVDAEVPEQMAALHAEFERIHPFLDGNGRVGRLAMNLILLRRGFPPAIIRKRDRTRYLAYLRKADAGEAGPLGELIARALMDVLLRFVVPAIAGPSRLVPIQSLSDDDLTVRALRAAAERGRLRAQRDDQGRWLSSRAWVEEYREGRHRRISPPS